jgi:hypothetical protein
MKRLLLLFFLFPSSLLAQWEYRGTIGKDLKIWMRLEAYADTAFGAYFYVDHGEEIKLYGNRKEGNYKLLEVNKDGKVTATLEFKEVDPYIRFEGTWKPVNKKKKPLPIKLFMLPPNVSVAGSPPEPIYFRKDSIIERNKKERYTINAYYPQFAFEDGYGYAQFNALIKSYVKGHVESVVDGFGLPDFELRADMNNELWMDYIIADTMGFVSVEFSNYIYYMGAAHGLPYTVPQIYSGRLHRMIELRDLFKPGTKYLEVLSNICIPAILDSLRARMRERYLADKDTTGLAQAVAAVDSNYRSWVENGAAPEEVNYNAFVPTRDGLWIIFDL